MPEGRLPGLEPFRERWPWKGPHLQTVRNTIVRPRPDLGPTEVLRFPMPDGSGDVLLGALNRGTGDKALAVLVHGLTGCQDSFYVLETARALLGHGHPVLRLNLRGAGPSAGSCRQRYHAGRTQDIRAVLRQLPPDLAARGLVLVGYSLGGNAVLKYLGEGGFPVPVRAGCAVSAPIDLASSSRRFLAPDNRAYHKWLLGKMKAEMQAGAGLLDDRWVRAAAAAQTVWQFDDTIVGPWNGWGGAEEYYRVNSAVGFLPAITVPTLLVHALDDPWIPGDPYLSFPWQAHRALVPLLPSRGGHVGFHGKGGVWHDRALLAFLDQVGA